MEPSADPCGTWLALLSGGWRLALEGSQVVVIDSATGNRIGTWVNCKVGPWPDEGVAW